MCTTLPVVWPTPIVIVSLFESVSTSGVPVTAWPTVAVYVIVEPSTTDAGAAELNVTVVVSTTAVTFTVTVAVSVTPPEVTVYVKLSAPLKSAFGV